MNILILNWRCWKHPWAGGAENYLHKISRRLVRSGHRVTWFVSSWEELKEREVLEGIELIRKGGRFFVYILGRNAVDGLGSSDGVKSADFSARVNVTPSVSLRRKKGLSRWSKL
jgi:hypothetical protein